MLDRLCLRPGFVLGRSEDRAQRQADADAAVMLRRVSVQAGGDLAHLGVRLAPQRIDVGVLRTDGDGGIRGAAEIDRDARLLHAAERGGSTGEAIEAAL